MASVRVRAPATTGNLGSGYDCAGMALELYNTVEFRETETGLKIELVGEGSGRIPTNENNLSIIAAQSVFKTVGFNPKGLLVHMNHEIPVSRGLGSSGVAIVTGAVAANELAGRPLGTDQLLRICSELEGHPDNVVPSLLGGFSVSSERSGKIIYQTFPVSTALKGIVAIPDFPLDTKVARSVLPKLIPMEDAVYNMCNVGLLVGSFLSENYNLLDQAMSDRIHQPYREKLIPGLMEVINKAQDAGAHVTALSGAGPTVIALATKNFQQIGEAMIMEFAKNEICAKFKILSFDNSGCQILSND